MTPLSLSPVRKRALACFTLGQKHQEDCLGAASVVDYLSTSRDRISRERRDLLSLFEKLGLPRSVGNRRFKRTVLSDKQPIRDTETNDEQQ